MFVVIFQLSVEAARECFVALIEIHAVLELVKSGYVMGKFTLRMEDKNQAGDCIVEKYNYIVVRQRVYGATVFWRRRRQ